MKTILLFGIIAVLLAVTIAEGQHGSPNGQPRRGGALSGIVDKFHALPGKLSQFARKLPGMIRKLPALGSGLRRFGGQFGRGMNLSVSGIGAGAQSRGFAHKHHSEGREKLSTPPTERQTTP